MSRRTRPAAISQPPRGPAPFAKGDRVRIRSGAHAGAVGVVVQFFRSAPGRHSPRAMVVTDAGAIHTVETSDMEKIEGART